MPKLKDLTGQKFNRLSVLSRAKNRKKIVFWLCICDCGKRKEISAQQLANNKTKSCGCYAKEVLRQSGRRVGNIPKKVKHGLINSPEYNTWLNIKSRCHRKTATGYGLYGGRGIVVCAKWRNSFLSFYEDMGKRPSRKHSIERIDCNGNYEPSNCKWATTTEQSLNKRNNHYIEFNGQRKTITQWSMLLVNGRQNTVKERLNRGWSIESALTKPCRKQSK